MGQFPVAVHSTAMPINFFSFPGEVRNKIYEKLLVFSEPIILEMATDPSCDLYRVLPTTDPCTSGLLRLCPAILLANKRAHSEASPLLYSRNRFRLQDPGLVDETQGAILTSFLDHIGRQNASFLRHICMAFPAFDEYDLGSVTLQEDSIRTLELVRNNCTNIATLEMSLQTTTAMEFAIDALDSPRTAAEALVLVNARFKAISSLKEVIVNVYDETPSDDLRKKIRGCGWIIKVTELEESDGVGLFDEYDDYAEDDYAEKRREEEWEEEYYRRRRDLYWKNDSDYD